MAKKEKTRNKLPSAKQLAKSSGSVLAKRRVGRMSKRQEANRTANQEELRTKIAAGRHHEEVVKELAKVNQLVASISKKKTMYREEQAAYVSKLQGLKVSIDTRFRLLNKYLPDLRSIDFSDQDGDNPFAKAAAAWAEALNTGPTDDEQSSG